MPTTDKYTFYENQPRPIFYRMQIYVLFAIPYRIPVIKLPKRRPKYQKRLHEINFLHGMCPSIHTGKSVRDTLGALSCEILARVAYPSKSAHSDYHLFASMQNALPEQHCPSYENIREWFDNCFTSK